MTGASPSSPSRSSRTSSVVWSAAPSQWTLTLIAIVFAALVIAFASGCTGSRTVFVPEESPMRTGPESSLRVYHRINGEWTLSQNRITIPEGWYLVPPSYVSENADH